MERVDAKQTLLDSYREEWSEKAKSVKEQLERDSTQNTFLMMVVDDNLLKQEFVQKGFGSMAELLNTNLIFTTHYTGIDAIGFFSTFREQEKGEEQSLVTVIMDGQLRADIDLLNPYQSGIGVASKMLELCDKNNWNRPYFYSNSSDNFLNLQFNRTFTDTILPGLSPDADLYQVIEAMQKIKEK